MSEYLKFWLAAFVVLLVIEIPTQGLTTIWFALGCLAAALTAFLGLPMAVQVAAFFVVSIVSLVFTRPFAVKYVNGKNERTNVDALFGREARVIEKIDSLEGTGRVTVGGQEWLAASDDGYSPEPGEIVVINGVRGTKLIVVKKGE